MTNVCSSDSRRCDQGAVGREELVAGELDVEHEQRHRDGEDAVREGFDAVLARSRCRGRGRSAFFSRSMRGASPRSAGAGAEARGERARARRAAVDLEREHLQRAAAAAMRDDAARARSDGRGQRRRGCRVEHARAQDARRHAADGRERAGVRRRHGAHEVVDGGGVAPPVDDARPPAGARRNSCRGAGPAACAAPCRRSARAARRRARSRRRRSPCRTLPAPCRRAGSGSAVCATMSPASGFAVM